ncbi:ABC transporter substrate-binding protein [Candidatus Saccharibacteria bacterium]|nr:ABC transporter substrate-binding protein [Candidatus Saccharibacteria bacterium]
MSKLVKKSGLTLKNLAKKADRITTKSVGHLKQVLWGRLDNAHRVRRQIIGWVLMMAVLIGLAGLQFVWYRAAHETVAFGRGGTFVEATLGRISNLNPIYATTNSELVVARLVFSGLFRHDTSGNIKMDLARSVTISEEGLVYDVELRQGIRWHDGEKLSAEDVVFTLEVIQDPRSRSLLHGRWRDVEVEQIDEYTVRFRLPSVYAAFEELLTFAVIPKHILGDVEIEHLREHSFGVNPVGTGPFNFGMIQTVGRESERIVHLTANEYYHGGRARLDRFLVHAFETREGILAAVNSARVSGTAELTLWDEEDVRSNRIHVRQAMTNSGVFAFLNNRSDTLSDARVRRAVRYGLDMELIRSDLVGVLPLDWPILEGQVDFELPEFRGEHNLERAKELIEAAGLEIREGRVVDDYGVQVRLRIATIMNENFERVVREMERQLLSIGFAVDVLIGEIDSGGGMSGQDFLQDVVMARSYDILVYEIEMGMDPDGFVYYHSSQRGAAGMNLSEYSSLVADDLLVSARAMLDPAMRRVKREGFLVRWNEDVPAIGLFQTGITYFHNRDVRIFSEDVRMVTGLDRFSDVIYWGASRGTVHRTP